MGRVLNPLRHAYGAPPPRAGEEFGVCREQFLHGTGRGTALRSSGVEGIAWR